MEMAGRSRTNGDRDGEWWRCTGRSRDEEEKGTWKGSAGAGDGYGEGVARKSERGRGRRS
jgi:hypothetical protein